MYKVVRKAPTPKYIEFVVQEDLSRIHDTITHQSALKNSPIVAEIINELNPKYKAKFKSFINDAPHNIEVALQVYEDADQDIDAIMELLDA